MWFYRIILGPALIIDGILYTVSFGYFHVNCGLRIAFLMSQSRCKNKISCNPNYDQSVDYEDNSIERRVDSPLRYWSRQKQEKWYKEYREYWNLTENDYVDEQDLLDFIGEQYELVSMNSKFKQE